MISIPIWLFTFILTFLALLIGLAIGFAINPNLKDTKELKSEKTN